MNHSPIIEKEKRSKQITKSSGSNFSLSFFFLPPKKRKAITCVYAFCRLADNVIDEATSQTQAKEKLGFWYKEVEHCYSNRPSHPVSQQIQKTIREFNIPKDYFLELLRGVEMDLYQHRYKTFDDLYEYCYRVASVVGLICIEIFGYKNPMVREHAIHQGLAFQMTNILRDVKVDAGLGRIYLPQEDMEKFQYKEQDLLEEKYNPEFQALMRFEAQRAKDFYRKAKEFIPREDRPSLIASEIMGAIYYHLLEKIEKNKYNVFDHSIRLSSFKKITIALGTWLRLKLGPE